MRSDSFTGTDARMSSGSTVREAAGPYLRALRHHWRFVILITLLAAAVGSYTLVKSHRSYQGSASVLLTPLPAGDPAWIGIGAVITSGEPDRDTQTGVALIDTAQSARITARAMGPGWTMQSVENAVSVTPLGESDVISITAKGSTPQQAARLANTYASRAVALRSAIVQRNINRKLVSLRAQAASASAKGAGAAELTSLYAQINELQSTHGDPTLSVSQAAQPPTTPIGTSRLVIIVLCLVGGFLIASVAALGLEFVSRPVRDQDELEDIFPSPVLAAIPPIRHAGSQPIDPWRLTPEAFEQIRMLRIQLDMQTDKHGSLIMVTSAGPGDGKTSVVSGLAASLSESGRRTVVIDLDLRKPRIADALMVDVPSPPPPSTEADWLDNWLLPVPSLPNVSVLPLAQIGEWTIEETMSRLPRILRRLQSVASTVLIDTAPVGEVSETLRIARLCKTVVFVARLRHTDRRVLSRARELLLRVGATPDGLVIVGRQIVPASGYGYGYGYANRLTDVPRRSAASPPEPQPVEFKSHSR